MMEKRWSVKEKEESRMANVWGPETQMMVPFTEIGNTGRKD